MGTCKSGHQLNAATFTQNAHSFSGSFFKVPKSYIEQDSEFLQEVNRLLNSLGDMPDAIGLEAWKTGLSKIVDARDEIRQFTPQFN